MAANTLIRRVLLQIAADDGEAAEKIDAIKVKADELRAMNPTLIPRIDTAEAQAKMNVLRQELRDLAVAEPPVDVRVASAEAQAKLDAIKANAEELRVLNPTIIPRIDDAEASAKLAVLRGELTATEEESAGLGKAWEVTKYALLGVGAGLAYGTVKAAGFEQEMLRVHTQAGVAKSQLGSLGGQVLQLAGQVGQNPDSLAESLYHVASNMASMGATGPQMMNAVRVAAEGASLGGADLVDVTNALGASIASGIPGVQNYQSAMGALNATVGAGDMTMQDLAEAMGTGFLSNVKIYGSTLNDVGAILATFGDNNIRGAHAGTQLRMSVQSIAVQASTATPYLKELGLQVGELGKYQSIHGTVATIDLLVQKLKASGIAQNEWGNIITQLFGKKAGAGIAVLIDQYDRLNSKQKVLAEGAKGFAKAWEEQSKSPQQQLKDLEAGSEALAISLGIKLLPVATKVLSWLNDFIQGLQRGNGVVLGVAGAVGSVLGLIALKKLEDGLKGAVEGLEGLWNGGTKLISWAGDLAGKMGLLKTAQVETTVATEGETAAQEGLNVAMDANPIGLIILGISALVIGFVELWKHCAGFRDFWKAAWKDIKAAFDETWGFIKSHWQLILGIITGPIGAAALFVIDHWHQITSGAAAMYHDVVNFFTSLPGRILHALGDLGHLLWNAGVQIVQGLISGIESMASSAWSALGNLASGLVHSAMSVLGIHSPSKVMEQIGLQVGAGLVQGLEGSASQVGSAAGKLAGFVRQAFTAGDISYGRASWLTTLVERDNSRLQSLAARRAAIQATIKAADAYAAKVTSTAESQYGIVSAASGAAGPNGTPATLGGIYRSLSDDLARINIFKANIAKLRRMGLNKSYLDQIIQAGPDQGGPIAQALASGNEMDITQVNRVEAGINSASNSLGQTAADVMYDSGRMAGRGFLSGLQAQESQLTAMMQQLARSLVSTLRRELGIHSPSSVMREHGRMIGEGLALGIEDSAHLVTAAAQRMARSVAPAVTAGHPAAAVPGGAYGGRLQLEWVGGSADQALITLLKHHIRIRGGDPSVLGR